MSIPFCNSSHGIIEEINGKFLSENLLSTMNNVNGCRFVFIRLIPKMSTIVSDGARCTQVLIKIGFRHAIAKCHQTQQGTSRWEFIKLSLKSWKNSKLSGYPFLPSGQHYNGQSRNGGKASEGIYLIAGSPQNLTPSFTLYRKRGVFLSYLNPGYFQYS